MAKNKVDESKSSSQVAIEEIHKRFGKESIMRLDSEVVEAVKVISTGSIFLDKALGVGGYPRGRIVEIYGPESSGKTTLALHGLAEAQKLKENVAFIDAEHSLDLSYAQKIGLDVNKLWVAQPSCGEEALEIADTLIRSNDFSIVVIDSVAALTPKAELEGDMGASHMGLQARLMSQGLRKLTGIIAQSNSIVIFINQIRHKIGIMFGSPETTTGGNALKFYASIRLDIRKKDKIEKINEYTGEKEIIGNDVIIKVVKNKVAPPFKEVPTRILYGVGIDKDNELLQHYVNSGIIEKGGSWYKIGEERIQGEKNIIKYIKENPNLFKKE